MNHTYIRNPFRPVSSDDEIFPEIHDNITYDYEGGFAPDEDYADHVRLERSLKGTVIA